MKNVIKAAVLVLSTATGAFASGCSSPDSPDGGDSAEPAAAADEQDLTAGQGRQKLREVLFAADGLELWYRCTTGAGTDRITIDILARGSSELRARARYAPADYNDARVETSVELGAATIVGTEDGPGQLHYVFAFTANKHAARLDAGSFATGKGTLTVGAASSSVRCNSYDAPFSP